MFTFTCEDYDNVHDSDQCAGQTVPDTPSPAPDFSTYEHSCENGDAFCLPPQMRPIDTKLTLDLFNSHKEPELYRRRCTAVDECVSACECCRSPQPDPSLIPFIDEPDCEPIIFENDYADKIVTPKIRRILPSLSLDKSEESKPETADAMCQTPSSLKEDFDQNEQNSNSSDPKPSVLTYDKANLKLDINNESNESSEIQCRLKRTIFSLSKSISSRSEETDVPTYSTTESFDTGNSDHNVVNNTSKGRAKQILDCIDRKSWKSPDEFRPTIGTVKALTKHFNSINLCYSMKSYKRNCQSNPNLCIRGEPCANDKTNMQSSASLGDILYESNKTETSDTTKDSKLTDEEVKSILIQLEDWSKYGSRGSEDTLAHGNEFELPNLPSEDTTENNSSNIIVFNEIVEKKPKIITLDNIKLKSNLNTDNEKKDALVRRNSLEKMIGSRIPRVVAVIPRRHAGSLVDVSKSPDESTGRCRLASVLRRSCPHVSSKAPSSQA